MKLLTIKNYAKEQGVTPQAVYQMLSTHAEELAPHIVKQGRTQFLTDEAITILEKYRQQAPIVLERLDQVERIKELEQEREQLLIKVADLGARLGDLAEWKAEKAVEIAAAEHQQQLLTTAQTNLEQTKNELQEARNVISSAKTLLDRKTEEVEDLKKQLQQEQERRLTWRERLLGWRA